MPNLPANGRPLAEVLLERYGITNPRQAFTHLEAEARASGLDLNLTRQLMAYPTIAAHTLLRIAETRGSQHAFTVAVSYAYFIEGRNIADTDVLGEIAAGYGFNHNEAARLAVNSNEQVFVEQAAARAADQGVRSVPHFIFNNSVTIIGGQSEDALAAAIDQAVSDVWART